MNKSTFLTNINENWQIWQAFLAQVSPERLEQPGAAGDWSLKDVIAHITWHEDQMLGVIRNRALRGSPWWNLALDDRNRLIYEQYRDAPLEQVLQESFKVHTALLAALQDFDEAALNDPALIDDLPPEWIPWQLISDNTYGHYEEHRQDVLRMISPPPHPLDYV